VNDLDCIGCERYERTVRTSAFLLLLLGLLSSASAQERAETASYRDAINAAIEEYDAKNYAEALEQFRRAHALFPNARTLRGLAMAEFELRRYGEAIDFFEQALAAPERPLEGALREETLTTLARARRYVGELHLTVDPASAELVVDGSPRAWHAGEALRLSVGEHTLDLSASGRAPERRVIVVEGGRSQSLRLDMRSIAPAPVQALAAAPQAPRDDAAPRSKTRRRWLWATAGGLVAGAAVATALALGRRQGDDSGLVRLQPPALTSSSP
jgi:tetratricopeptide (TPR) repeat protein